MEKKIKILYALSIAAILAFLGMQVYWLYARYEYSLKDYEDRAETVIANALMEYDKERARSTPTRSNGTILRSTYEMHRDKDTVGHTSRRVTVSTRVIDGRKLLGIKENRNITDEEKERLEKIITDSLEMVETRKASLDVTSAPSDGEGWTAMTNFDLEIQHPFTVNGIDSVLAKDNISADISLVVSDSLMWKPVLIRHSSIISPRFKYIKQYSELEYKTVVIDCRIPVSDVLMAMGRTLLTATVLSLFLILCLLWQIRTIARLTRLDKMRNSFITTMIHELKRPISTLKMCVSGIDNDKLAEDEKMRHELMAETRIALDNLSAYFSKLRDITFNNVAQIPLNVSMFNLSKLTAGVMKSIVLPSSKRVVFENDVPDDLEMSADRSHFVNILTNLIENAIKYSGDEVCVKVGAEMLSDGCRITVADNGDGIPAADRDRIFDRFYRGKVSSTDIPGMGLGLAYVKLLVEAHGGEISVESQENVGSTFIITLPQ